jgi:hypothetical protein
VTGAKRFEVQREALAADGLTNIDRDRSHVASRRTQGISNSTYIRWDSKAYPLRTGLARTQR